MTLTSGVNHAAARFNVSRIANHPFGTFQAVIATLLWICETSATN